MSKRFFLLAALTTAAVMGGGSVAQAATATAPCVAGVGSVTGLATLVTLTNLNPGPDTIDLPSGCTYTLTGVNNTTGNGPNGLPVISGPLTISSSGFATIVRDSGAPSFRIFEVVDTNDLLTGGSLDLDNVGVAGGSAVGDGGGILVNEGGSVTTIVNANSDVTDGTSVIAGNRATGNGGGIAIRAGGTFNVSDFASNTSLLA